MAIFDFLRKQRRPFTKTAEGLSPIMPTADLPEQSPEAHACYAQFFAAFAVKRFDEAVDALEQALAILRRIGHRRAEVRFLYDLGVVQQARGKSELALQAFRQGLELAKKIRPEIAQEFRELSAQAEQWTSMMRDAVQITGIPQEEWHFEAMCLRAMALVYMSQKRPSDAEAAITEALRLLRESPRVR